MACDWRIERRSNKKQRRKMATELVIGEVCSNVGEVGSRSDNLVM